jgi:importin subunit beta-1
MDAWGGIIGAMKSSGKSEFYSEPEDRVLVLTIYLFKADVLQPYVESIFQLLNTIANDMNRSEALMRAAMGVIG